MSTLLQQTRLMIVLTAGITMLGMPIAFAQHQGAEIRPMIQLNPGDFAGSLDPLAVTSSRNAPTPATSSVPATNSVERPATSLPPPTKSSTRPKAIAVPKLRNPMQPPPTVSAAAPLSAPKTVAPVKPARVQPSPPKARSPAKPRPVRRPAPKLISHPYLESIPVEVKEIKTPFVIEVSQALNPENSVAVIVAEVIPIDRVSMSGPISKGPEMEKTFPVSPPSPADIMPLTKDLASETVVPSDKIEIHKLDLEEPNKVIPVPPRKESKPKFSGVEQDGDFIAFLHGSYAVSNETIDAMRSMVQMFEQHKVHTLVLTGKALKNEYTHGMELSTFAKLRSKNVEAALRTAGFKGNIRLETPRRAKAGTTPRVGVTALK